MFGIKLLHTIHLFVRWTQLTMFYNHESAIYLLAKIIKEWDDATTSKRRPLKKEGRNCPYRWTISTTIQSTLHIKAAKKKDIWIVKLHNTGVCRILKKYWSRISSNFQVFFYKPRNLYQYLVNRTNHRTSITTLFLKIYS